MKKCSAAQVQFYIIDDTGQNNSRALKSPKLRCIVIHSNNFSLEV